MSFGTPLIPLIIKWELIKASPTSGECKTYSVIDVLQARHLLMYAR